MIQRILVVFLKNTFNLHCKLLTHLVKFAVTIFTAIAKAFFVTRYIHCTSHAMQMQFTKILNLIYT